MAEEKKTRKLGRREFLKGSGALAVATGLLAGCESPAGGAEQATTAAPPTPAHPPAAAGATANVQGPAEEVPPTPTAPPDPSILEFFSLSEARTVDALAAVILPGSPDDPGAREAGVLNYIDHLLAHRHGFAEPIYRRPPFAEPYQGDGPPPAGSGPQPIWVEADKLPRYGYQSSLTPREIYRLGLAMVDSYSTGRFGARFADLSEADQEAVVAVMAETPGQIFPASGRATGQAQGQGQSQAQGQSQGQGQGQAQGQTEAQGQTQAQGQAQGQDQGQAAGQSQDQTQGESQGGGGETGFHPPALREFFEVLRNHVIEGMFGDPLYGGNRDLVGWRMLGYPGAQRAYTPGELLREGTDREPQSIAHLPHFNPGQPANEHVRTPVSGTDRRRESWR